MSSVRWRQRVTVTGQNNLRNMNVKIKEHAYSRQRLNSVVNLGVLGQSNITSSLNTGHALSITRRDAAEHKIQEILSKIFSCIKLCGKCELPLRGHDESSKLKNSVVFCNLLHFACKFDTTLEAHLKSGKAFKGTS